LAARTRITRNLVYSARSKTVDTVIVDGKVMLECGEFVALAGLDAAPSPRIAATSAICVIGKEGNPNCSQARHLATIARFQHTQSKSDASNGVSTKQRRLEASWRARSPSRP